MKLEVGKAYVTENGSIVNIDYNTNDLGYDPHIQPFGGMIRGRGCAFYTESGIYNLNNPGSGLNIVSEVQ